jgi:hypothetical protein
MYDDLPKSCRVCKYWFKNNGNCYCYNDKLYIYGFLTILYNGRTIYPFIEPSLEMACKGKLFVHKGFQLL